MDPFSVQNRTEAFCFTFPSSHVRFTQSLNINMYSMFLCDGFYPKKEAGLSNPIVSIMNIAILSKFIIYTVSLYYNKSFSIYDRSVW